MGGKSQSSTSTTQIANDNRTFIDDRDIYDNRQDNRVFNTIDAREDNRTFIDSRQDNSVTNISDNRVFTTIDDRDDNRTFIDDRDVIDNSVDHSIGEGAIVTQGGGDITITETTTDHGATEQAFQFASDAATGLVGAFGNVVESQKVANSQIVDAILKNSEGGMTEGNRHMVYASLFASASMVALIAFRKGF